MLGVHHYIQLKWLFLEVLCWTFVFDDICFFSKSPLANLNQFPSCENPGVDVGVGVGGRGGSFRVLSLDWSVPPIEAEVGFLSRFL